MFQPRLDQENLPRGPSLRVLTTSTRHSTSTSPSTAPIDTPVSTYSLEEPSSALSYAKHKDRSVTSLSTGRRETRPAAALTRKGPSPEPRVSVKACENVREDEPSRVEEHNQFGRTRVFHHTTKPVTPNQESEQTEEGIPGSSPVRPSSGEQANARGKPIDRPLGASPGRVSSGKGTGQRTVQARIEDVPALEAKVTETRAQIEELMATRETLDEELNGLTSEKERLQDEIAHYVKVKVERSKSSLKTGPAQHGRPRTASAPSKNAERATSILSAIFLLHSIAIPDTPP